MPRTVQASKSINKQSVFSKIDGFTSASFPNLNRTFKALAEANLENAAVLCDSDPGF